MVATEVATPVALEPKMKLSGKIIKTTLAGALVDIGQPVPGVLHISKLQKESSLLPWNGAKSNQR